MSTKSEPMTSMQARAARAALRLSIREMAKKAGIGVRSVNLFETGGRETATGTKAALRLAFEGLGVRFPDPQTIKFGHEAEVFAETQKGADIEGGQ